MKIRPVGAELFHADGQAGMTKLIVVFRSSVNASKNGENNVEYAQVSNFCTSQQFSSFFQTTWMKLAVFY
jgi:hypothetical protein